MVINVHKTTHVGIPWGSDICHFLPMVTAQNCTAQIGVEKATGVRRPLNNPDTPCTEKYSNYMYIYIKNASLDLQVRIHTGFHHFPEIGQIFLSKYIFSK